MEVANLVQLYPSLLPVFNPDSSDYPNPYHDFSREIN